MGTINLSAYTVYLVIRIVLDEGTIKSQQNTATNGLVVGLIIRAVKEAATSTGCHLLN